MIPVKYNYRNLVVRKTTTIAAAFGLALVVFVFAAAQMLGNGIKKTLGRSANAENAIVLRKGSSSEMESGIEESQVNLVLAQAAQIGASKKPPGVGEVLVVILMDKLGTNGVSNVTVRGVPEDVFDFRSSAKIIEGRAAKPGSDEVVVGAGIRGRFKGLELNQTFEIKKNRPVKVVASSPTTARRSTPRSGQTSTPRGRPSGARATSRASASASTRRASSMRSRRSSSRTGSSASTSSARATTTPSSRR